MSDELLLHISLIPGIGAGSIEKLLSYSDDLVYGADQMQLMRWGMTQQYAQLLYQGLRDMPLLRQEQEAIERAHVRVITLQNPEYSHYLRAIHRPPLVLYVQGSLSLLQDSAVAIVGSRMARGYGREAIESIVPPVVRAGWAVISGGARGIDAYAHQETLKAQGKTVAVLGSGLLQPYPAEHRSLFERIASEGGAVISPFPLNMSPVPGNFPARNRIIAGMSRACIIVQAAIKSGALITAAHALAEGRDVGAVPGSIFDPLSAGCHRLLRDGAVPITSPSDVEELIGVTSSQQHHGSAIFGAIKSEVKQGSSDDIVVACKEPKSFDELLEVVGCEVHILHQRIWDLQVNGIIEQTCSGLWRLIDQ